MINRLYLIEASGTNPTENLALESVLMDQVNFHEMILYLWQNDNTVVIGRNQNVRKECRLNEIKRDGVHLVRRSSGGGAVYHDLGNLNFTFLTDDENYSEERQSQIICNALRKLGIEAERTGRNDILCQGKKFSGNAYYHHNGKSYQHGTLLIHSDLSKMPMYLQPDPEKYKARGVDSVRSRVTNLADVKPGLTIDQVRTALIQACEEEYGVSAEMYSRPDVDVLAQRTAKFASPEWIYGQELPFDTSCEKRFPWGSIRLEFRVEHGIVTHVSVWSDSMEPDIIDVIPELLQGSLFQSEELCKRLSVKDHPIYRDLCELLKEQV